jgi:hypothetical protein
MIDTEKAGQFGITTVPTIAFSPGDLLCGMKTREELRSVLISRFPVS